MYTQDYLPKKNDISCFRKYPKIDLKQFWKAQTNNVVLQIGTADQKTLICVFLEGMDKQHILLFLVTCCCTLKTALY